jgi:signal transduction histidine kinase
MLTSRRIVAPISRFARAAERFGVDASAPAIVESGPYELRKAARAFNLMQERLKRFVHDRTQMLAAMSHDLRTPLNRLRLRVALIEDGEQQRKMRADLEAMGVMLESTLAFMRDDSAREQRTLVDLGVLIQDVCEDASGEGGSVAYSGSRGVNVSCRPVAIARAVANLVDNAVKYGIRARVFLFREEEHVVIAIEDDGPGIPPVEQENVFTPFYRLEPSRNSATGDVGLGLSVARTVAREHGGDITLTNRDNGGLLVRMRLPVL